MALRPFAVLGVAVALTAVALPDMPARATAAACLRAAADNPLIRRYQEGEALHYLMKGTNDGRRYQASANGIVRRDDSGRFVEEYGWFNLVVNGVPVELSAADAAFRQVVSLDPTYVLSVPNLAPVTPNLVGPVLDFLNFYADLSLAMRQRRLAVAGDGVFVPHAKANSWADGRRVLIGEDAIDFIITLTSPNPATRTAIVTVRHVPPAQPQIQLPADWMHAPVGDTANNWVQVATNDAGGYDASVGQESFDVCLTVVLSNGSILSATMDNVVDVVERRCGDAALVDCGAPVRRQIKRSIELTETAGVSRRDPAVSGSATSRTTTSVSPLLRPLLAGLSLAPWDCPRSCRYGFAVGFGVSRRRW